MFGFIYGSTVRQKEDLIGETMYRALLIGILALLLISGCVFVDSTAPINKLQQAATQGDAAAQFQMGLAYDRGIGVKQDLPEAAKWYRAAAEQGNVEAQNSLGSLYQAGEGVTQDYVQAKNWYQKAADLGNVKAKSNLAYLYDLGLGVPTSPKLATQLYEQSAELGELKAMLNLGILLTQGKPGVDKDYVEAYKWLDLARFYTQSSNDMDLKWRARGKLDELSALMTPAQIEEGKKRTSEWDRIHRLK